MVSIKSENIKSRIKVILEGLNKTKAIDIKIINLEKKGLFAEAMIVANGHSSVHIQAIASNLCKTLQEHKISYNIEGESSETWVLIDCGDVVIHVFSEESRKLYALEKIWS